MPVDGGEHIVRASAPGRAPFSATVVIENESDAQTIQIPLLASAPASAPASASAAGTAPPVPAVAAPPRRTSRGGGARRAMAWTTGGAGLVQWGAAGYFGLQAFRKHAESNSGCPN